MSSFPRHPTMQDFVVHGLEAIQPAYANFDGTMYAGMLPSDNGNRTGMTMFWLFQPTTQEVSDSMVLWLNGGPGCSSFNCGLMMEHSPVTQPLHNAGYCCLKATPQLLENPHAWTRGTTMLYVEHPIGTGFSHGNKDPQNEQEASGDLDAFLQNFYNVFEPLQSHDFYVMGESYAGMFVPSVARYIRRANQRAVKDGNENRFLVPLKGAAIGNGWIEPKIQGPATIDYSWYHGMIDQPTRDALHNEWENCMAQNKNPNLGGSEPPPFHPFNVQDDCGIMWGILQAAGNNNAYDVSTWDPNVDQITFSSEEFFNNPLVKDALHVLNKDHFWHGCQAGSGRRRLSASGPAEHPHRKLYMDNDRPLSVVPYMAELLDDGFPLVVYNGDRDMTTNMVGTELSLNGMDWSGKNDWLDAPRGLWNVDDYPAGWAKEYKNLTYVVVYNSGHMVPYNVPTSAYDLLLRLLTQKSFVDVETAQIRVPPKAKMQVSTMMESQAAFNPLGSSAEVAPSHQTSQLVFLVGMALIAGFALGALVFGQRQKHKDRRGYEIVPEAPFSQHESK